METNTPLEGLLHFSAGDEWIPISIAAYVEARITSYNQPSTVTITKPNDRIYRLREVYANLIEKLYDSRLLNLTDIASLIGEMPQDVRVRRVK